ncbi:YqgQ family protein [Bacillus horti]|uniref:Uncharacterized protein YqgQ n=2 Tax=Caldalkalibacillus horti TaxID=77523 RepID=A0ABT9W3H2_9BACI|nr:YqgQ family protein [Bacillus horti]MDQ0167796.1 uncharacterized protein YqgQ [Bacillus horti]
MLTTIQSMQDVRNLLKKYGTFIYTKDPIADLELMDEECHELYQMGMLEKEQYVRAKMCIMQEIGRLKKES